MDINNLLNQVAASEEAQREEPFLAPCVRGGLLRVRIAGLVATFQPKPRRFEGWGIFLPVEEKVAEFIEEPTLPQVDRYMQHLKPLRVRLVRNLQGTTWLAYPHNESDMKQRFGQAVPIIVFLVVDAGRFDSICVRGDGCAWWFEDSDRRADPIEADKLREALAAEQSIEQLAWSGLTPEMRIAYVLAANLATPPPPPRRPARQQEAAPEQPPQAHEQWHQWHRQTTDEERLGRALAQGGGQLHGFRDSGDHWLVEWVDTSGAARHSAISKDQLTVISAGICLDDHDADFDLQSLVGVMEGWDEGYW